MFNLINPLIDIFKNPEVVILVLCVVWDFIWKWVALYKAWQRSQWVWFVFMFIFNTVGILPIIYLVINRDK